MTLLNDTLHHSLSSNNVFCPGSEEGAEQVKQELLKAVGKVTDLVSSMGFSWWQGGPPHTQTLKDLHWVSSLPQ